MPAPTLQSRPYSGDRMPPHPGICRQGRHVGALSAPAARPAVQLSRREGEVAALIALGLTDKQIASVLVVSPRTVEAHVASALRKTECTSRTQLAVRHVKETLDVCK
jgi:DNA-binding NarL/FixJ family response regulator